MAEVVTYGFRLAACQLPGPALTATAYSFGSMMP